MPPTRRSRRRPGRRGVVVVITLLALVLLVGLVLFVLNVGRQANTRVAAQNAADAAVISGAGLVSRQLNTAAMNNVAIARDIAAVQVLDAMPQSVDYTLREQQAMAQAVDEQLARAIRDPWVRDGLQQMAADLQAEIDILQPIDDTLNRSGLDVRDTTFYESPSGRGQLWRAMEAMDQLSQAALEDLAVIARHGAEAPGQVDLRGSNIGGVGTGATLMLPLTPAIPWQRGRFDDFERPVVRGLLPRAIDHQTQRRGPFDTVFGWRDPAYDPDSTGGSTAPGRPPPSRSAWTGHWPPGAPTDRRIVGYTTYGPFQRLLRELAALHDASLRLSRFKQRSETIATIKLGYVWPQEFSYYPPSRPLPLYVRGYRTAADKAAGRMAWEIPLVKDYQFWFDGPNLLRTTPPSSYFYLEDGVNQTSNDLVLKVEDQPYGQTKVTYISQATMNWVYDVVDAQGNYVLEGLGQGMNGRRTGTYSTQIPTPPNQVVDPKWVTSYNRCLDIAADASAPIHETAYARLRFDRRIVRGAMGVIVDDSGYTLYDHDILWPGGFWPRPQGLSDDRDKVDNHIWVDERRQILASGPDTTIEIIQAAYFVFLGANTGDFVAVRNPNNFVQGSDMLPAPVDLDYSRISADAASRRQFLTFLGLARVGDEAPMWPAKFSGNKPSPHLVGLAQARVFNNHSFDLWTQMWHVQLEALQDYDAWLGVLDQAVNAGDPQGNAPDPMLTELQQYLRALQPLAGPMAVH